MTKIIDFYFDETGNEDNEYLKDILSYSDGFLEMDHSWVQFVFPTNEPSGFNYDAPVLTKEDSETFIKSAELKDKVKTSLCRMLRFFELEIVEDGDTIEIEPTNPNPRWL